MILLSSQDREININKPPSYEGLLAEVNTQFSITSSTLFVHNSIGRFLLTSQEEYQSFFDTIERIEIIGLNLSRLDSVDTNPSQDHDTEEIKGDSNSKICQTDPVITKEIFTSLPEERESKYQNDDIFSIKYSELETFYDSLISIVDQSKDINSSHFGFKCDVCKSSPILGIRFECKECNKSFCEKCEDSHHHDLIVIKLEQPKNNKNEERVIRKVLKMGLGRRQEVVDLARRFHYDLNKIVEELLFK